MNYSKIFKFLALIVVILFFSYLNSHRDVIANGSKNTKESFTSNIREYYNKKKRYVRRNIEDFKTTGLNTIESFYKKYNN